MGKIYKAIFILFFGFLSSISPQSALAQYSISASVSQDVSCFNGGDGEIDLTITPGTAPYRVEFFLQGGSEIPIATINNTSDLNIILSDNITVSTGTVTYSNGFDSFGIRANDNPELVTNVGSGTEYRVRVISSDASFNERVVTGLIINEPDELTASVNTVVDDCDNLGSGEIQLDVTGGTTPYSFVWTGPTVIGDVEDAINLDAGDYDVTVTDDNGCTTSITGIVVESGPIIQNVTNLDPTAVCSGDDLTVSLDNSESTVTYEVLVNGVGSGETAAGVDAPLDITLPTGSFVSGDVISVRADDANCPVVQMNGSFTVNVTTIAPQNVTNINPTDVCPGDDLVVSLDGTQSGVTYEVLVDGVGSGATVLGDGTAQSITLPSIDFADGQTITVEGQFNGCTLLMTGSFVVNLQTVAVQNITNLDPTAVCSGDDLTVSLDNSESTVTYEVLVNGVGSGVTAVGVDAALDITLPSVNFADGDVITVQGQNGTCAPVLMNGSFSVNVESVTPQNITNLDPTAVCSGDDLTVSLDNSESTVTYEVLVNGVGSGVTAAGVDAALDITLPSANFVDGDVITVEGNIGGNCVTAMNGSFTVNVTTIAPQNVTNINPTDVCPGDDLVVSLDGTQSGVTYEVLVDGVGSGATVLGDGTAQAITLPSIDFADGQTITVEGQFNGCTLLMTGSFVVNLQTVAVQNVTNLDPTAVCSGDDLTVSLDNSESTVTYEVLVNGVGSGVTAVGVDSALDITLPSVNFADGDVITVQGQNGTCAPVLMNGSFSVNVESVTPQNVTNLDPTAVCSGDDLTVSLDNSESTVTYEVLVNGVGSGVTAAGVDAALDITLPSANFVDGDVITVEGNIGGNCVTAMNGSFTVNVTTIAPQNVTNLDPTAVCSGDDLTVSLDNSESTVTYEVLVNGVGSGVTAVGVDAALDITLPSVNFADGDVITVQGQNGTCAPVLMNGSFSVNVESVTPQNITNLDPTAVCSGDDLTVSLDNSESTVTYEVLVNGVGSGVTAAGVDAALDITLPSANFVDGDVITVEGNIGGNCVTAMNGSFTVNVTTIAPQNVTNINPTDVCPGDDLVVSLDGTQSGVTYEVLVDGVGSGATVLGDGTAQAITLPSIDFADGQTITVEGQFNGCTLLMTGSFVVNLQTVAVQNVTNLDPTAVCSGDDLTVSLDNSESTVTYEVLVNGVGSGVTAVGVDAALDITLPSVNFADGDVITVQGQNGTCAPVLMNGSFSVNVESVTPQNITNLDPTAVCSGDDLTVSLDNSESTVTYEVLVNGVGSGVTAAGVDAALDITLPSANFVDGDVITVEGNIGGNCVTAMNGSFTVNVTTIAPQNVTNINPTDVCPGDDLVVSLDGTQSGVTYEVLVDGVGSGATVLGDGTAQAITLPSIDFADGQTITVEGQFNGCTLLMTGSFVVNLQTVAVQNVTNLDPTAVCSGDDLTVSLDNSESTVTYEVLVNGVGSGVTAVGVDAALDITLPSVNFADGDVITVQGQNGTCAPVLMNGSFSVNVESVTPQNVTNLDPTAVCSGDDLTVSLDNSESTVTYEVLVNGVGSGVTAAGVDAALDITLPSANFVDGDVITVEGNIGGNCVTAMNGSFTVNVTTIAPQNVTNLDPTAVCSGDDLTVSLDNSESTVTYEVLVNGVGSGVTAVGVDAALDITLPSVNFADGDVITVQGQNGTCAPVLMNGSFSVNVESVTPQNITNLDPTAVCSGDDLTVSLDNSESTVTYEVLVNGVGSGVTAAGVDAALDITLPSANFVDGDVITVEGNIGGNCVTAMNGSFTVNVTTIAPQNVTNINPTDVCPGDDLVVSLDGTQSGVTYEVLVDGVGSGATVLGDGTAQAITLPSIDFADGQTITVEGQFNGCTLLMTGSFVVNLQTVAVQNVTNLDPTAVCSGDDLTVSLDNSESTVTYEVLVNGVGSGVTAVGVDAALDITLPSVNFADGDVITVQGQNGTCAPVLMNGNFSVNVQTVVAQNILNSNPIDICAGDDLVVSLDDSQNGVTYTVFVGGIASTVSVISSGGQLDITIPSAEFNDGDNITVEGNIGGCPAVAMNNPFDVNIVDFTLNPTVTNTTGCAVNDGAIELAPLSDSAGDTFSFSWVGPNSFTSLSEDIAGLDGGSYTVTITSSNSGCTFDSTIVVVDPVPYTINVTSINPQQTCNGSDGGIDINITGGTGPNNYYIVDTNSNTEVAGSRLDNEAADTYSYNLLPPGDYEVFVEEGACSQSQTFTVNPVDQIAASISNTALASCGAADGQIELSITDVGNDYEVAVTDGTQSISDVVVAGTSTVLLDTLYLATYDITITDLTTNCQILLTQDVDEDAPFSIANFEVITDIQTCGGNEGAIDIAVSGVLSGSATFTWTGPAGFTNPGTADLTNLSIPGNYQLTVQDGGCTDISKVYTVTEPNPITAVSGIDSTICLPDLTLYADALGTDQRGLWTFVSGPSTITFDNDTIPTSVASGFTNLGDYVLQWKVTDSVTTCVDSSTVTITRKDITLADAGSDQGVCIDNTTLAANSVDVNETGIWSLAAGTTATITNPNDPSSPVSGLSEGINEFIWTISDDNLICSETTDTVTVYYDMPMEAGGSLGPISMTAVNPDTVLVDFLDGTQDPDGIWSFVSGPATIAPYGSTGDSIDFTGQVSGQYEFKYKVQDSLACSADSVNVIIDYLDFQCDDTQFSIITEDASCAGVQDGLVFFFLQNVSNAANLQAVINTTDTLTFSNPGNGNIVELDTTFLAGNYNITLYDQLTGCDSTKSIIIGQKQSITPTVEVTDADCETSLGEIQVNLDGNTFEFVLLDSTDAPLDTTTTGLFTNLTPAEYAVAINNSGVCQVDTIRNLIIAPADSVSAGDYIGTPGEASITNSTFVLDSLLDDSQDSTGVWTDTNNVGATISGSTVDLAGLSSGTYTFTYTVINQNATCSDAEDVFINYDASDFTCAETKLSVLSEEATCQGVQDGTIFLFLQNVSNTDTLNLTINSVVMDTFSIDILNPGSGSLLEIDTAFFSGNYELVLTDSANNCTDTINVLIGQKQSIIPLINTSDATCDNPVGQVQVTLDDTFDFVLLDANDEEIETNATGLFTDLEPATYGIAFNNSGGCQVDTVKNIIINEPTEVSNSALDLTVVEPSCNTTTAQILVNFELEGEYLYQILDTAGAVVDSITTDAGQWTRELDSLGVFELVVTNSSNPGLCEPNNRNFNIERSGGFTATVTDKTDVACFGASTGSVTIELDGIASGFYSLDGTIWTEFISGEPITDLPARQSILVSDQAGSSDCELSVQIGIEYLSEPIEFVGNERITLVTQASCTVAEEIGVINVPEVTGGVSPYIYSVDGNPVELDAERNITGLARNVNRLTITDDTGCSESFDIRSIVSPNEVRAIVTEIDPQNNCLDDPEGILVAIDQTTIDNVPGPYNLILNKVNETTTSEYVLDINTNGSNEFTISQFDLDNNIPFEKGARYRWTVRAIDDDQACSADNFVTINGGAIIPTFNITASDVACFQESGSIELSNIRADETIPLNIEVYEGNDVDPTQTFTLTSVPESGRFLIDQSIYGLIARGDYIVKLNQQPGNCSSIIESEAASVFIDAPVAQLNVELVPEPNLPPGVDRDRASMNPMPTTRPDRANGSISIRLVEPTSGANSYSAQIFLLTPLAGNNSSDYVLPSEPIDFGSDQVITFENLLPGVYEIEYYDSFGCGTDGNRLVFDSEGSSDITVDFDRSPFIPNVFTPNNDGKNDVFRILNLPDNGAELIVTNRTGTIVYRDNNYRSSNLWDGGDNPDGIYFYQLTVDGNVQNGWVEIIRGKR